MADNKWTRSFYGVLMILIGALGILRMLGTLPGGLAGLLAGLWPLILVYAGINTLLQGKGALWSIALAIVGIWLILINFGFLPDGSFASVLKYWPFLLALIGLEMMMTSEFGFRKVIWLVVSIILAGAGAWVLAKYPQPEVPQSAQIFEKRGDSERAEISYKSAVSDAAFILNPDPEALIHAELLNNPDPLLAKHFAQAEKKSVAAIELRGIDWTYAAFKAQLPKFDADLPAKLPITLSTQSAIGNATFDLHNIDIEVLNVVTRIGKLSVMLDPADGFSGRLTNLIGGIELQVPANLPVRLQIVGAADRIALPAGYRLENGVIYSPSATNDNAAVRFMLDQPFGAIRIIQKP